MMKILKTILLILLAVITAAAPFVGITAFALYSPAQYDNSFVGALDEKVERLYSIEEEKIVIVGGSSVAFGVDSALIEKYTGMPVVNFGLYAALGTKLMLDLSVDAINEGDIVIIAPELDAQTLSLYFSTETTLQAFDGSPSLLTHVREENFFPLLGGIWNLAAEKYKYMTSGEKPDPDGVYNSKNFNAYGDVVWERNENIMSLYYDPNVMIDPDPSIISEDFVEYLNEYAARLEKKGAVVCFGFCPMNELGFEGGYDSEKLDSFSLLLSEKLDISFMGDITDFVYAAGYFYDTNFHLNDAGVRVHTVNLLEGLLLELGIPTYVDEEIPEPPKLPASDNRFFGEDENAKYFTYEKMSDGSYFISGLTEEGKALSELTVPLGYNTYKVRGIKSGAFRDSKITVLNISADTNLKIMETGALDGARSLARLNIYYAAAEHILPPAYFDFSSMAESFAVHVPEASAYDTDYYWSARGLTFVKDLKE